MKTVVAIFTKQLSDLPRNAGVSLLYVMFPLFALVMGSLLGDMDVYAGTMAAMYVASTPMVAIAMTVAEDVEFKSLRFLVMAGVKPSQYLAGLTGFVLLMSLLPLACLAIIGGYTGPLLINYFLVSILGLFASAILGAAIGIFSRNVQQSTAIYTPFMMVLMLMPMFAMANETLEKISELTFSYQVGYIVFNPEPDLLRSLIVIAGNIAVLLTFFIFAYKKKGLRG